jgi:hypothetical protein
VGGKFGVYFLRNASGISLVHWIKVETR